MSDSVSDLFRAVVRHIGVDNSDNLSEHEAMEHSEFIKALGSGTDIAARLSELAGEKVDREAVYKWDSRNNIPWRWRVHFVAIAREKNIALPGDFLPGMQGAFQ